MGILRENEFMTIKYIFYIITLLSFVYIVYLLLFASYVSNYILARAVPCALIFFASSICSCILLVNERIKHMKKSVTKKHP